MTPQTDVPIEDATPLAAQAWNLLLANKQRLGLDRLAIQSVAQFVAGAEAHPTSEEDRGTILNQAVLMFRNLYPHMPFKTDIYHFEHPADFLEQGVAPQLRTLSEADFHDFIVAAFSLVRDAHSLYFKPSPFRGAVAFLPFEMRPYLNEQDQFQYTVIKVMGGFNHSGFVPGAQILAWGAEPIENHIQRAAGRLPGGNTSALHTRAAIHSTVRPLTFVQLPFDDELPSAVIRYTPPGSSEIKRIQIPWAVATGLGTQTGFPSTAFSVSALTALTAYCSMMLQDPDRWIAIQQPPASQDPKAVSTLPNVFEFLYTNGPVQQGTIRLSDLASSARPDARFGYIRIKSFGDANASVGAVDRIVNEFQRILTLMDEVVPDGLILDIRGNPGGEVRAAERMLQMLTPLPVTPQRFHLANTPAILQVLANINSSIASKVRLAPADDVKLSDAKLEFGPWLAEASNAPLPQGERLTNGQPLTDPAAANDTGQIYQGPKMLLVDGLTYSAADIFAAGFQDHAIGRIFGPDATTGGGGATVWTHGDLLRKMGPMPGVLLEPLPGDASMSLAIRRSSRVAYFNGQPIEDVGIKVDLQFAPRSVDDVVQGYPSLIRTACLELGTMPSFRIEAGKPKVLRDGSVTVDVKATVLQGNQQDSIQVLQFFLNKKLALKAPPGQGTYTVPAVAGVSHPVRLRIEAYQQPLHDGDPPFLVAVRNISLLI